jgi:Flp pilus assembly protein TadG
MALLSPVFMLVSLLILTGAQLLSDNIGLANAARAGAQAAALAAYADWQQGKSAASTQADATAAATVAVDEEEAGAPSCSRGGGCVTATPTTGATSGTTLWLVSVYSTVSPFIPLVAPLTISASAGAAQ